jgi:hypothetical protein
MGNLFSGSICARKETPPEDIVTARLIIEKPTVTTIPKSETAQTVGLRPIGYEKTVATSSTQEEDRRKFGM